MSKKIPTSFIVTRKFVRSLGLKSTKEWNKYSKSAKRPKHIPSNPVLRYANEWTSWGDFLGTGRIATRNMQYRSFKEARKFVRSLKLTSNEKWKAYCKSSKKPDNIPKAPRRVYKKEWKSMCDWLGTGRIANQDREYKPFEEARKFATGLGLKSKDDWSGYIKSGKLPNDVPRDPRSLYKGKGWTDWGDFLGTGRIANQNREFMSFSEAKKFVHKMGIKSQPQHTEFIRLGKKPPDLPSMPSRTYKKEWKGWGDYLGTGRIANQNRAFELYPPFKEAKKEYQRLAKKYGIKNRKQWFEFAKSDKMPKHLPKFPEAAYSKEKVLRRMKK